jgi:hypothetical protein
MAYSCYQGGYKRPKGLEAQLDQGEATMKFILTMGARLSALLFILFFCSTVFADSTKVEVCHVPPDNPENFHTIKISVKALPSHLAHGDLGEPCNAVCTALCDDGNACTIDDSISDCELNGCPVNREPVECDDENECTADSCDPTNGCINTPRLGEACDDDALCTGPDTCDAEGMCTGVAIDSCCLKDEDCSGSLCDHAECNLETNRCGNSPVVCSEPDLCTVSECAPDTGVCVDSPIVCDGEFGCNPANGQCAPVNSCPCFDLADLRALGDVIECGENFPGSPDTAGFFAEFGSASSGIKCATTGSASCN